MNSIYERLVNLPIFKGVSIDFINTFAEKTPLEFIRYSSGEEIINEKHSCDEVICLISGMARRSRAFCSGELIVEDTLHSGSMIGLENLYGLHTEFGMSISASEDTGIMRFSKKFFFQWLSSSNLLLLNFINYLSRCAQNGTDALKSHGMRTLDSELSYLIQIATEPGSTEISIISRNCSLEDFLAPGGHNAGLLDQMEAKGLIEKINSHSIRIRSRADFLDAYRKE